MVIKARFDQQCIQRTHGALAPFLNALVLLIVDGLRVDIKTSVSLSVIKTGNH